MLEFGQNTWSVGSLEVLIAENPHLAVGIDVARKLGGNHFSVFFFNRLEHRPSYK